MSVAALDEAARTLRPRLVGIAYRMLGSLSDAEDVVQDAIVRARSAAPDDLRSPEAYLVATTSRVAIDHLRSAHVRRETYVGPWLPEPLVAAAHPDAADLVELADSVSMAFLVMLENLTPAERAVLVLHDILGYGHAEVGALLHRSEGASRQLLRRARHRVDESTQRHRASTSQHRRVVERFMAACEGASVDDLLAALTEDAVLASDGGGTAKAARRPIVGAARIARFLSKVLPLGPDPKEHRLVTVNGEPAFVILHAGQLSSVVSIEPAVGERVGTIWIQRNPEKLRQASAVVGRDAGAPSEGSADLGAAAPHGAQRMSRRGP